MQNEEKEKLKDIILEIISKKHKINQDFYNKYS